MFRTEHKTVPPTTQQVLAAARREAARLRSAHLSSAHILLGLLDEPATGTVATALAHFGIDTRAMLQSIIDRFSPRPPNRPPD